jgi:hypothetical protein
MLSLKLQGISSCTSRLVHAQVYRLQGWTRATSGLMELKENDLEPQIKDEDLHQTPKACCLGTDIRFL